MEGLRMLKDAVHNPSEPLFTADCVDVFQKKSAHRHSRETSPFAHMNEPFFAPDSTLLGQMNAAENEHLKANKGNGHTRDFFEKRYTDAYKRIEREMVDSFADIRTAVSQKIGLELTREQEACHLKISTIKR